MKTPIFFILLLSFNSYGLDFIKQGSRLLVTDSNCELATNVSRSLSDWTRQSSPNSCPPNLRTTTSGNQCQIDVTSCVPPTVLRLQGSNAKTEGPNCWNLALVMKGILPHLRFSSPEEMSFYMRPPLCRALRPNETKMPGDIGAIRTVSDNEVRESHGFIYISEDVAFSKNGTHASAPYMLQSLENVYQTYQVPNQNECRGNQISTSSSCENGTSFYRCTSMQSYLNSHPQIPAQLKTSLRNFGIFESCLEDQYTEGSTLSSTAQTNLEDSVKVLTAYLEQNRAQNRPELGMSPEERDFILGSMQLRLSAIIEQIDYSAGLELSELNRALARSIEELKK